MLAAWFSVAFGDLGSSVLTARALAAKNESVAARGFIYGGLVYLVLGMIPVIVGMCAFILNASVPEVELDNVFPWFVHNYLPGWISIMFFLAIASAIVSTAGDTVLTCGALLGYTVLRVIKPDTSDRQRLRATRMAMILFAATGLLIGLALGDLYKLLVFAGAVSFPAVATSSICGIFWKKANVAGSLASIATGVVSWLLLIWILLPYAEGEIWDAIYIGAVPAFVCSFLAMIVVSLLTQKSCPPNPARDVDGRDISDTRLFSW
jgi:Na+/proline symporter